jgi:hypothetical protein
MSRVGLQSLKNMGVNSGGACPCDRKRTRDASAVLDDIALNHVNRLNIIGSIENLIVFGDTVGMKRDKCIFARQDYVYARSRVISLNNSQNQRDRGY